MKEWYIESYMHEAVFGFVAGTKVSEKMALTAIRYFVERYPLRRSLTDMFYT